MFHIIRLRELYEEVYQSTEKRVINIALTLSSKIPNYTNNMAMNVDNTEGVLPRIYPIALNFVLREVRRVFA